MPIRSEEAEKIRRQIRTLSTQHKGLLVEAHKAKSNLKQLRENYQPQIDEMQARADELALQFKEKYAASNEAYEDGDGELAKELSLEGHELQEECEELNRQVNELRPRLSHLSGVVQRKFNEAAALQRDIDVLLRKLKEVQRAERERFAKLAPAKRILFANFLKRDIEEMRSFIASFPTLILGEVERITYETEGSRGKRGAPISGRTGKWPGGKYFIQLFRHDAQLGDNILKTVAHELGHIGFDKLTPEQKRLWEELYADTDDSRFVSQYAMRSAAEDFCDCVAEFKTKPQRLAQLHPAKYAFVKELMEENKP